VAGVPVGRCTASHAYAAPASVAPAVSASPSLAPASSAEPSDAGIPDIPVSSSTSSSSSSLLPSMLTSPLS